ncbi:MAG: histidinol-phosphatase [Lasallia pustulata]|uniref:Histidinol-phosphatase n=1 Tax=Lasallia pustulata TaxID=136370 RepID=A0A5M8Q0Y3_9LECA|nr:MAG: histidinol-phosphatase [Lasallia pustulata]
MPFSHHSHSGQFCGHATNTLEEVVQKAIALKFQVFALTEHMPRDRDEDLYPEEVATSLSCADLSSQFAAYYHEAVRLRSLYAPQIHLLIGVEIDWIRPSSQQFIESLFAAYAFDLFVGSVHHVYAIPIDYDAELYERARCCKGGGEDATDEQLFADYFDAQWEMLRALRPPVVGHFDLVRLKSRDPERSFRTWERVWGKAVRNLEFVAGYGGLVELNSAALRKGMSEPYPKAEICEAFLAMGGRFTLSDDSHGVEQVGANYGRVLDFVEAVGIREISYLERGEKITGEKTADERFRGVSTSAISLSELRKHAFWT